jgi:hypothetical protein
VTDDAGETVDESARAAAALGEPLARFTAAAGWQRTKYAIALGLVLFGIIANYWWWFHGPGQAGNFEVHFLAIPPILGFGLFFHLWRNRGLVVLVYDTGVLRMRRGECDAFPWAEITDLRMKAEAAELCSDAEGCWFEVSAPTVRVWDAWIELTRADGVTARFSAVLADYAELAERVQKKIYSIHYLSFAERIAAGETVQFGEFWLSAAGVQHGKGLLPWQELGSVVVSQKSLAFKRSKGWLPWALRPLPDVPLPHVCAALASALAGKGGTGSE